VARPCGGAGLIDGGLVVPAERREQAGSAGTQRRDTEEAVTYGRTTT
jgi:hypothetical protein